MNSDSWCSPTTVTLPLARFFGGAVDLDPCSNVRSLVRAREAWSAGSLHREWFSWKPRRRTVYMNPPYSRLGIWVPYLVRQFAEARRLFPRNAPRPEAIALVPVATSAGWWSAALQADALMFTRRLTFVGDKPFPARFDAVLLYFGDRVDEFRKAFADLERWFLLGEDARRLFQAQVEVLPPSVRKTARAA
jgi:hypothetical protein